MLEKIVKPDLSNLIEQVDAFYGGESRRLFQELYLENNERSIYKIPLLNNNQKIVFQEAKNLEALPFTKLNALKFVNRNNATQIIKGNVKFPANNLSSLFQTFTSITCHTLSPGDLRITPEYYADVFSNSRYFFFHGDGQCFTFALLYQALAKKLANKTIRNFYCQAEGGKFTHVYCGSDNQYIDTDQKIFSDFTELKKFVPRNWYLNLIQKICLDNYLAIRTEDRNWMFSTTVSSYLSSLECHTQYINEPGLKPSTLVQKFREAIFENSELLDINKDDYPWKKTYREIAAKGHGIKTSTFFMDDLARSMELHLPPGATFQFPYMPEDVSPLLEAFSNIFFGKIPSLIQFEIKANTPKKIQLPENPWLLSFSNELEYISINEKKFSLNRKIGMSVKILGMGDLEGIRQQSLEFLSPKDCTIGVYLPINSFFWNSDAITLTTEENEMGLDILYSTVSTEDAVMNGNPLNEMKIE